VQVGSANRQAMTPAATIVAHESAARDQVAYTLQGQKAELSKVERLTELEETVEEEEDQRQQGPAEGGLRYVGYEVDEVFNKTGRFVVWTGHEIANGFSAVGSGIYNGYHALGNFAHKSVEFASGLGVGIGDGCGQICLTGRDATVGFTASSGGFASGIADAASGHKKDEAALEELEDDAYAAGYLAGAGTSDAIKNSVPSILIPKNWPTPKEIGIGIYDGITGRTNADEADILVPHIAMDLVIPSGVSGGDFIKIATPTGVMRVQVPHGLVAGDAFRIDTRVMDVPENMVPGPLVLSGPGLGPGSHAEPSQLVGVRQSKMAQQWDQGHDC